MENRIISLKLNNFKSVRELLKVFSTEKKCEKFLKEIRWGKNVVSPYNKDAEVYVCSRNRYRCAITGKDTPSSSIKSEVSSVSGCINLVHTRIE